MHEYQTKKALGQQSSWKEDWCTRNRWIIQPKAVNRFLLTQNATYFALYLILILADPTNRINHTCNSNSLSQTLWTVFSYLNQATAILCTGIIGWPLRKYKGDAFSLKTEISITFYLFAAAFSSWFILLAVGLPLKIAGIGASICVHTVYLTGIVFPYFFESKRKKQKK